jgi:hypothetical protein
MKSFALLKRLWRVSESEEPERGWCGNRPSIDLRYRRSAADGLCIVYRGTERTSLLTRRRFIAPAGFFTFFRSIELNCFGPIS